jgi:hypothetical protein
VRRIWSVLLLLAGALLLLASLYLPWQEFRGRAGVFSLFAASPTLDGWSTAVGPAAALFALLLATMAVVALARPDLTARLPLGRCALFAGYFGLAVGAQTRSVASGLQLQHVHFAYGAYLGIAGVVVALLAASVMRWRELVQCRSAARLAVLILVVGLLVALLLPWQRSTWGPPTLLGIASPAAVVAAVLLLCLLVAWWRVDSAARADGRLVLSAAAAVFTGAAVGSITFPGTYAYGAWVGLGIAVALVALALIKGPQVSELTRPGPHALATGAAATLFVTGLFLPWQRACYTPGRGLGPLAGHCVSTNGWTPTVGSAAAVLAIALVMVAVAPRRLAVSGIELATGLGLLVATLGFQLIEGNDPGLHLEFGYGSTIGFAAAALLVALAVTRLRPPRLDWNRVPVRLAPIAACAGYLVVVVLPWWDVLPRHSQSVLRFAPLSWLTIVGALVGIRLLGLWVRQIKGASGSADLLVILPLALLALAALDLIRLRANGITWGGGVVVGLCLLLVLSGRAEQLQGIQNLRVPEILRVDRL